MTGSHVSSGVSRDTHRDAKKNMLTKWSSSKASRYPGPPPVAVRKKDSKKHQEYLRLEDEAVLATIVASKLAAERLLGDALLRRAIAAIHVHGLDGALRHGCTRIHDDVNGD